MVFRGVNLGFTRFTVDNSSLTVNSVSHRWCIHCPVQSEVSKIFVLCTCTLVWYLYLITTIRARARPCRTSLDWTGLGQSGTGSGSGSPGTARSRRIVEAQTVLDFRRDPSNLIPCLLSIPSSPAAENIHCCEVQVRLGKDQSTTCEVQVK